MANDFVCLIQSTEEKNYCGKFAPCNLFIFFLNKQAVLNLPTLGSNHCHFSREQGHEKKQNPSHTTLHSGLSPSIKYFIIISLFIYKYTLYKDIAKFTQG